MQQRGVAAGQGAGPPGGSEGHRDNVTKKQNTGAKTTVQALPSTRQEPTVRIPLGSNGPGSGASYRMCHGGTACACPCPPGKAGQLAVEARERRHKGGSHVGWVEVVQGGGLDAQPARAGRWVRGRDEERSGMRRQGSQMMDGTPQVSENDSALLTSSICMQRGSSAPCHTPCCSCCRPPPPSQSHNQHHPHHPSIQTNKQKHPTYLPTHHPPRHHHPSTHTGAGPHL